MKIGLTVWDDWIAPVCDASRRMLVADVFEGQETGRRIVPIEAMDPYRRVEAITSLGIDVLICGAISRPLGLMITGRGITLLPFITGEIESVLSAYLAGRLPSPDFLMPGCRGRHRRFQGPPGGRGGAGPPGGGRGRGRGGRGRGRGGGGGGL